MPDERTGRSPLGRLCSPVLVGRERELGLLLDTARSTPAVIMVEGEAGVGKTRLVEELIRSPALNSYQRIVGRCHQLGEPFPLGPVLEALGHIRLPSGALSPVVGALRPLLPELADRLPAAPEALGEQRADRHRQFRAIRELLAAAGAAVLVLEDLHWADQGTVELLRFLLPQLPDGLAVVCTYRREDLAATSPLLGLAGRLPAGVSFARVALAPLRPAQVRDLVGEILQSDDVSQEFADYLHERTAGLPFAVEEVLLLLRERDDLVHRHGVWVRRELDQIGVPAVLRDSILERMGGLPEPARRVLAAAATVGVPASERVLLDVAEVGQAQAGQALADALGSRLLVEAGERRYAFRHALARQAVEDSTPAPLRRRLHQRAAHALEATEPKPYARLAHHFRAAGDTASWIRYAEAASDRAISLLASATAYELLEDAVSVPNLDPATRGRLAVKLAVHAYHSHKGEEAIGIARRLLADGALEPGARGELRMVLARLLNQTGLNSNDEVVKALEDLGHHPALAAEGMAMLARPWLAAGGMRESLYWLDRAMATVEGLADPLARRIVAVDRAVCLLNFGDPGWRRALAQVTPPGTAAIEVRRAVAGQVNLASTALRVGHYRTAAAAIESGCRLCERAQYQFGTAMLKTNQLLLDWATGAWDGLDGRVGVQLEAMQDWVQAQFDAHGVAGLLALATGRVKDAVELLTMPTEPTEEPLGLMPVLAWMAEAMVRVRLAEGDADAAVREADRALRRIEDIELWTWAGEVVAVKVEALLAAGREPDAGELTSRLERGIRGRDAPAAAAALGVCHGLLAQAAGEHARAAREFLAAEQAWRALPNPYQAIRAGEAAGRCLLATDPDRGCRLLRETQDAFTGLGAAWDAARVGRRLREHGVLPPQRRGRRGYGGDLSPRERQVARLAGEGLTNHEIALALFVSTKTVEKHLSSAMHKLGISSRTELAPN